MTGERADPERIESKEDLGRELSLLRSQSGLTVRELAKRLGTPVATVGDYFSGRHLPGPRQVSTYRALLEACGVEGGDQAGAWMEALARARRFSDGRGTKPLAPYRGLEPFGEAHSELFFGRRAAVEELINLLTTRRDDPSSPGGLVVVVGASGAGKSSLLMAGLVPAVNAGALDTSELSWRARVITAAELVEPASPRPAAGYRWVYILDAFEEVLTGPPDQRTVVVGQVSALARHALVVLALRADFYQAAAAEEALADALRRSQLLLGPMTSQELREAVTGPAHHVGAQVEYGLVDIILADLAPGAPGDFAHDPGALPLLSYALLAAWERATRNHLTIADYRAVGGLWGAVHQAAERLYQGLDRDEEDLTKHLFARLVRVGDGPPIRRRASRADLLETGDVERDHRMDQILERFVAARLVTADVDTVQISHEALLTAWPRLAEWVEEDREWLHLHQQLSEAAHIWESTGRDDALLWRGGRLQALEEHGVGPGRELNRLEGEFVGRSTQLREQERQTARRRIRRARQALVSVALLAVAACVLAGVAVASRAEAVTARDQALSRQVAIESQQLDSSDPSLAAQLAVAGYRIAATVQARSTLLDATAAEVPFRLIGPIGPEFVSLSSSGRVLVVAQAGDDTVAIYHLDGVAGSRDAQIAAGPASAQDFAVALSPDGRLLAVGGTTGTVTVFGLADPHRPVLLAKVSGLRSTVYALTFAPGGRALAAADADGTVHQWAMDDPHRPQSIGRLRAPGGVALKAVAYLPGDEGIAAAGENGVVAVWPTGQRSADLAPGTGSAAFQTIAVSAKGRLLAAGAADGTVRVWNVGPGGQLQLARSPLVVATSEIDSTAFSPGGTMLAVGASDGTLHILDTRTWQSIATLPDSDPVTAVSFSPGATTLVSADSGGVARLWPLPLPSSLTEPGSVFYLGYADGGRRLYAVSDGPHGDVTAWATDNPMRPTRLAEITLPAALGPVAGAGAVSPDGQVVVAANRQAQIQLIDVSQPRSPRPLGTPLVGAHPSVEQLGFSPGGRLLVAGDDSGQLLIWDISDRHHPRLAAVRHDTKGEVLGFSMSADSRLLADAATDGKVRLYDIANPYRPSLVATVGGFSDYAYDTAFTPDGRTLVAGSADGTIRIWNIADPARPRLLGRPLSGPSGYVYSLAVSPDGRTLAAATTEHAVWLWDISHVSHPRLLATLGAAQGAVFAVTFSPDATVLVASGSDDLLHLWAYQPKDAVRQLCTASGQGITQPEWTRYLQGVPYRPPCR